MTVMALMAVRRFALFTSRPRALGSTCNVADPDDAPPAMSVSGTSPVSCSSTEAGGSATRLSPAWRRRACRSCRSTVCSATAPQKRSTSPSAVPRTRSRFWISPTDGSFLPFSTSDRCEDERCTSLASASRLNRWATRSRRTSAPSSARREVAGPRGFGGRPSRPPPPLADEGWSCTVRHLPNFFAVGRKTGEQAFVSLADRQVRLEHPNSTTCPDRSVLRGRLHAPGRDARTANQPHGDAAPRPRRSGPPAQRGPGRTPRGRRAWHPWPNADVRDLLDGSRGRHQPRSGPSGYVHGSRLRHRSSTGRRPACAHPLVLAPRTIFQTAARTGGGVGPSDGAYRTASSLPNVRRSVHVR